MTDASSNFRFTLENRGDYLYVKVEGKMLTREEMLAYQGAIADAMKPELCKRIMIDGRAADRPLIELRAEMWTWMGETPHLRRIAIIADEEKTQRRISRTADSNRMLVVGFNSVENAETWLRSTAKD